MSNSPLIWDVGENIPIEIFVGDPNTGVGLTGQAAFISITIKRDSDNNYWSGSAWGGTLTNLTPTETNATDEPGRYRYILSGSTGNIIETRYVVRANINNPPTIQADSYEFHVSKITDVKVYEAEPA